MLIFAKGEDISDEFEVDIQAGQVSHRQNLISLSDDQRTSYFIEDVQKVVQKDEAGIYVLHGSVGKLQQAKGK